ncbi:MAG: hypothetical protein ACOCP4_00510 [Candidatus Woesearchaeota archaeon]
MKKYSLMIILIVSILFFLPIVVNAQVNNLSLVYPQDGSTHTLRKVNFTYYLNYTGDDISCDLYTNRSGSFTEEQKHSITSDFEGIKSFDPIPEGENLTDLTTIEWYVYCHNSSYDIYSDYQTFFVDYFYPPIIEDYFPQNESRIQKNWTILNLTCSDPDEIDLTANIYDQDGVLLNRSDGINNTYVEYNYSFDEMGIYNFNFICNDTHFNTSEEIEIYADYEGVNDFHLISPINETVITDGLYYLFNWSTINHTFFSNYSLDLFYQNKTHFYQNKTYKYDNSTLNLSLYDVLPSQGIYYWNVTLFSDFSYFSSDTESFIFDPYPPEVVSSYPNDTMKYIVDRSNASFSLFINESSKYINTTINFVSPDKDSTATRSLNFNSSYCENYEDDIYECFFNPIYFHRSNLEDNDVFYLENGQPIEIWYDICDVSERCIRYPENENFTFYVDEKDPSSFDLIYPSNHLKINKSSIEFEWEVTNAEYWDKYDANFFDYYEIQISNSSDFSNISYNHFNQNNKFNNSVQLDLIENETYFWRVIAYSESMFLNETHRHTFSDSVNEFIVDASKPSPFEAKSPANLTISLNQNPFFNWTETYDYTFQNYSIYLSFNESFDEIEHVFSVDNISKTNFTPEFNLSHDRIWYWKIRAYDYFGRFYETKTYKYLLENSSPEIINFTNQTYFLTNKNNEMNITIYENTSGISNAFFYFRLGGEGNEFTRNDFDCETYDNKTYYCSILMNFSDHDLIDGNAIDYYYYVEDGINFNHSVGNKTDYFTSWVDLHPPYDFNLTSPNSTHFINNDTFLFNWSDSGDSTDFSNYSFYLSSNDTFNMSNLSKINYTTHFSNSSLNVYIGDLKEGVFYWKVIAYDKAGRNKNSSNILNFTIDRTNPNNLTIIHPMNDTYYNEDSFNYTLNWSEVIEDHFLNYTIYLENLYNFSENFTFHIENKTQTYFYLNGLNDSKWNLEITAYDKAMNYNSSNVTFYFDKTKPDDFNLTYPNMSSYLNHFPSFNWSESQDNICFSKYILNINNGSETFNFSFKNVNDTEFNSTGFFKLYSFNLSSGNITKENWDINDAKRILSNDELSWNVTAYDCASNFIQSQNYNFTFDLFSPYLYSFETNFSYNVTSDYFVLINSTYSNISSGINESLVFFKSESNESFFNKTMNKLSKNISEVIIDLEEYGFKENDTIYYYFNVTDNVGYQGISDTFYFDIDRSPPTHFNLTIENNSYFSKNNVNLTWNRSYDSHFSNYHISVFNSSNDTINYTCKTSNRYCGFTLDEGDWYYYVTSYDLLNHSEVSNQRINFSLDLTPPSKPEIIFPKEDTFLNNWSLINWSNSNDNYGISYYSVVIYEKNNLSNMWKYNITNTSLNISDEEINLKEDINLNVNISAYDYASNYNTSEYNNIYLDKLTPSVKINSPNETYHNYSMVGFNLTINDNTGIKEINLEFSDLDNDYRYNVTNDSNNLTELPKHYFFTLNLTNYTFLNETPINFNYTIIDLANNSNTSKNFTFYYDNLDPREFNITTNGTLFNDLINLTWNESEDLFFDKYEIFIFNDSNLSQNFTYFTESNWLNISFPNEGIWNYDIISHDEVGQSRKSITTEQFEVDITSPKNFSLNHPHNITFGNTSINFSWEDSHDKYFSYYNLTIINNSDRNINYSFITENNWFEYKLKEGNWSFYVTAYDEVNNLKRSNEEFYFYVDTTPPQYLNEDLDDITDKSVFYWIAVDENSSMDLSLYNDNESNGLIFLKNESHNVTSYNLEGFSSYFFEFYIGNLTENNTYFLNMTFMDLYNNSITYNYSFNTSLDDGFIPAEIINFSVLSSTEESMTLSWDYDFINSEEYFIWDFDKINLSIYENETDLVDEKIIYEKERLNYTFNSLEKYKYYTISIEICDYNEVNCFSPDSLLNRTLTQPPQITINSPGNKTIYDYGYDYQNISFVVNLSNTFSTSGSDGRSNCTLFLGENTYNKEFDCSENCITDFIGDFELRIGDDFSSNLNDFSMYCFDSYGSTYFEEEYYQKEDIKLISDSEEELFLGDDNSFFEQFYNKLEYVPINFTVTDDFEGDQIVDCNLYENGNLLYSKSNVSLNKSLLWNLSLNELSNPYSKFNYSIKCIDESKASFASENNLEIKDFSFPHIKRNFPSNNSFFYEINSLGRNNYNVSVDFNFSLIENNDLDNCTFWIKDLNGSEMQYNYTENINLTKSSWSENIINIDGFSTGEYVYNVKCVDEDENKGYGDLRSGFESINNSNLFYFEVFINHPPVIENLSISSYSINNVTNNTSFSLDWDAYDPSGYELNYDIYYYNGSNYNFLKNSSTTNIDLDVSDFVNQSMEKEFLVVANDSEITRNQSINIIFNLEKPTEFNFNFSNINLVSGNYFNYSDINFSWTESNNINKIIYDIILYNETNTFIDNTSDLFYNAELPEGFWNINVSARDIFNRSRKINFSFIIDKTNPTKPILDLPYNMTLSSEHQSILFNWTESYDLTDVNYQFLLSNYSNFSNILYENVTDNNFISAELPMNGEVDYYWKVIAYDKAMNKNESRTYEYYLDNKPPRKINAVSPLNDTYSNQRQDYFEWNKTYDPNFSNYTFYFKDSNYNTLYNETINDIDLTYVNIDSNLMNETGDYFWTIRLSDGLDNTKNQTFKYTYDITPPQLNISNLSLDDSVILNINSSKEINFSIYVNDSFVDYFNLESYEEFEISGLNENTSYEFKLNGTDLAGNYFEEDFEIKTDYPPKIEIENYNISILNHTYLNLTLEDSTSFNVFSDREITCYADLINSSDSTDNYLKEHTLSVDLMPGWNNISIECFDEKGISNNKTFDLYSDFIPPKINLNQFCPFDDPCKSGLNVDRTISFEVIDMINISYYNLTIQDNHFYGENFSSDFEINEFIDFDKINYGGRDYARFEVGDYNNNTKVYYYDLYLKHETNLTDWMNRQRNEIENNFDGLNNFSLRIEKSNGDDLDNLGNNLLDENINIIYHFNLSNDNSTEIIFKFNDIKSISVDWRNVLSFNFEKSSYDKLFYRYGKNSTDSFIDVDFNDLFDLSNYNHDSVKIYFENSSHDGFYKCHLDDLECFDIDDSFDSNFTYEYDTNLDKYVIHSKSFSSFFAYNDSIVARPNYKDEFKDAYNLTLDLDFKEDVKLNLSYEHENVSFWEDYNNFFSHRLIGNKSISGLDYFEYGIFMNGNYSMNLSYCDEVGNCETKAYSFIVNDTIPPKLNVTDNFTISGSESSTSESIDLSFYEPIQLYVNDNLILDYNYFNESQNYTYDANLDAGSNHYEFKVVDINGNEKILNRNFIFDTTYEPSSPSTGGGSSSGGSGTGSGAFPSGPSDNDSEEDELDEGEGDIDEEINQTESDLNQSIELLGEPSLYHFEYLESNSFEVEPTYETVSKVSLFLKYSNMSNIDFILEEVSNLSICDDCNYNNFELEDLYFLGLYQNGTNLEFEYSSFKFQINNELLDSHEIAFVHFKNDEKQKIEPFHIEKSNNFTEYTIILEDFSYLGFFSKEDEISVVDPKDPINETKEDVDEVFDNFNFLIFLIPILVTLVIFLAFISYKQFYSKKESVDESLLALLDYIVANQEDYSSEKLKENLINAGWSKDRIKEAFELSDYLKEPHGSRLIDYIRKSKRKGFNTDKIIQRLIQRGWDKRVILYILEKLNDSPSFY